MVMAMMMMVKGGTGGKLQGGGGSGQSIWNSSWRGATREGKQVMEGKKSWWAGERIIEDITMRYYEERDRGVKRQSMQMMKKERGSKRGCYRRGSENPRRQSSGAHAQRST
jgi:hypothetical protein